MKTSFIRISIVQSYPRPVSSLTNSVADIENAYLSGNAKVVSMMVETTANSATQVVSTFRFVIPL